MTKLWCCKSCIIINLSLCCLAQNRDPGGWQGARWGMTETEVLAAVPRAERNSGPDARKENRGALALVTVPEIEVVEIPMQVLFWFAGGKLQRVLIQPRRREDDTVDDYCRIERALVQKYGRPWRNTGIKLRTSQWTFPATVVTLELLQIPAIRWQSLSLVYAWRDPAAAPPLD